MQNSAETEQALLKQSHSNMQMQVSEVHEKVGKIVDQMALLISDRMTLDHTVKSFQEHKESTNERLEKIEDTRLLSLETTISENRGSIGAIKWTVNIVSGLMTVSLIAIVTLIFNTHDVAMQNQNTINYILKAIDEVKNGHHP
jgi:hypothetical protein